MAKYLIRDNVRVAREFPYALTLMGEAAYRSGPPVVSVEVTAQFNDEAAALDFECKVRDLLEQA